MLLHETSVLLKLKLVLSIGIQYWYKLRCTFCADAIQRLPIIVQKGEGE